MIRFILLAAAAAFSLCAQSEPRVFGADGVYLGRLSNNPMDPEAIGNPMSPYGSPLSPNSIHNPLGKYGSPQSPYSPYNPMANPPVIRWSTPAPRHRMNTDYLLGRDYVERTAPRRCCR